MWDGVVGVVSLSLPWTAPIALAFVAAILLAVALNLRNRFADEIQRARVNPFFAARAAMFARAGSRTGALIAGAYAGVALFYLPDLDVPARRDRVVVAAVSIAGVARRRGRRSVPGMDLPPARATGGRRPG